MKIDLENIKLNCINYLNQEKTAGGFASTFSTKQAQRNQYISIITAKFDALINNSNINTLTDLLNSLTTYRISLYTESTKTESTFGDALRVVHEYVLEQVNNILSSDAFETQKSQTLQAFNTLRHHAANQETAWNHETIEQIKEARIKAAALGNTEVLSATPPSKVIAEENGIRVTKSLFQSYPAGLYQESDRVKHGIASLATQIESSNQNTSTKRESSYSFFQNGPEKTRKNSKHTLGALVGFK